MNEWTNGLTNEQNERKRLNQQKIWWISNPLLLIRSLWVCLYVICYILFLWLFLNSRTNDVWPRRDRITKSIKVKRTQSTKQTNHDNTLALSLSHTYMHLGLFPHRIGQTLNGHSTFFRNQNKLRMTRFSNARNFFSFVLIPQYKNHLHFQLFRWWCLWWLWWYTRFALIARHRMFSIWVYLWNHLNIHILDLNKSSTFSYGFIFWIVGTSQKEPFFF